MGSSLPDLTCEEFLRRLRACAAGPLSEGACGALWAHYQTLRAWNPRLSLVGPGTAGSVVERHYGEALAALPLLDGVESLLDVGSGAGFPGFVLAAARPGLAVTLVEARQKKWAFLLAAARRAQLSCRCLNVRVGAGFESEPVAAASWRAVDLPEATRVRLASLAGRLLIWCGAKEPSLPAGWRKHRTVDLAGSEQRRIVEWLPIDR